MKFQNFSGRRLALTASFALACVVWLAPNFAAAEEAYEKFLAGLKEQGLFDTALDYLDLMRTSPLLTEGQKQELAYEEGRLLVDNARAENDAAAKTKLLDQARDRFAAFIKSNPSNPKAASAETELGNVLVERGHSMLDQANRPTNSGKKDALAKKGRGLLEEAKKVFDEAETKFTARSKEFPPGPIDQKKEPKKYEQRAQARADMLRARLLAAGIVHELAKSYPAGSAENKKLLQEAADKYKSLYEKYRRLLVGLMARLKEGQCYQDLGDTKRAIGMYETLLSQGDDAALRPLKAQALHLSLQCLTSDNEKNYATAVERGDAWLETALPADTRTTDGLGITYFTAVANKHLADTLAKPEEQARKKGLLLAAKKQAQFVSKAPSYNNPFRDEAQQLYRKLLGSESGEDQKEPANFTDALDRAKELLDRWQDRLNAVKIAAEMKDQANVPKYETEAKQYRDGALHYFKMALELRDDETPLDSVNIARYYLCFLDYQAGNFYDAAVMGEFVAKHYPKSQGGRQCAKIAMAAYLQTHEAARKAQTDSGFDRDKMIEVADFITTAWPGGEEADDAWSILLQLALGEAELDKAMEYLAKIPADSPRRGEADLKAGQALWNAYLRSSRRAEADRPPQPELDKILENARKLLDDGLKRTRGTVDSGAAAVTASMAAAALSLGQIEVEAGQADKALNLLNDAKIGPLTLVAAGDPVTKQGKFGVEVYKLALRAYVANQALDKAESTMESLEKLVSASGDADAASQLTHIYIVLGRELEQQLQRLRQEQKADELAKVSKGFELFLNRISSRSTGNTFSSLSWVAETFFSLGSGYDAGGAKAPPAEAKAYYEKSLETDAKIIKTAAAEKDFAPTGAVAAVKLRMARTRRRLREFKQARDLLVEVLKEKSNLLDAQLEAARTLQDWGAEKPEYYMKAIAGDVKHKGKDGRPENLLWGWAKIAVRTQSAKTLDSAFYEARYNQAKCYMEMGKKSGANKADTLGKAERDILFTFRIRPDLGGAEWRAKFDTLLKNVQQLLGNKKPTGLPTQVSKPTTPAKPVSTKGGKQK
jgi:cellulose synthase operon protein C